MHTLVENLNELSNYDLAIAACGYEQRSTALLSEDFQAAMKVAVGYSNREVLSFDENRRKFSAAGFAFSAVEDSRYVAWLGSLLENSRSEKLLVDISCLTRTRLAALVQVFAERSPLDVDFYYSVARFSPPGPEPDNDFLGPISDYFSGWEGDYGKPTAVISGLGYEHTRAMGVIEYLDPSDTWLFFPRSPITKYDSAVRKANDLLLGDTAKAQINFYRLGAVDSLVRDLSSLVAAARKTHRCVLLPLGPKLFAVATLLTATAFRDVSVWRASAGKFATPTEKVASGHKVIFRVLFPGSSR